MKSLLKYCVVLIGSLIFVFSCSSSGSGGKWIKPGSDESEFDIDYSQCKKYAGKQCEEAEWPGYLVQKNCFNKSMKDCMNYKGWEYRKP